MAALLGIPRIKNATAFHLQRWRKVSADPRLRQLPGRIETNRYGHIVMMPTPGFTHSNLQLEIGHLLKVLMNGGACAH
ncbi:hypothetical protein [Prosthecobacter sp.]|uniref:hypothetical protein n=1 Tax=Prosthecobacter sp. TaxID=1965333 RepID=UPI003783B8EA